MKKSSKVLVTGGAGFMGSHITERLLDMGHEVIILDDLSDGFIENILNNCEKFLITCNLGGFILKKQGAELAIIIGSSMSTGLIMVGTSFQRLLKLRKYFTP